jgi:uncharacterized membrane protein HdeD (DUF308 family)
MSESPITRDEIRDVTWAWWVLMLLGVLSVVAGAIVIAKPSDSLSTLAVICGIFILFDSIMELGIAVFAERSGAAALLGVVGIVIGIILIRHPTHSVLAIALLIGLWLIAIGVIRLVRTFALIEGRVWNVVVAAVEIIAGIVIVSSPNIGFGTLAVLVGLGFILQGLAMVTLGWSMFRVRRDPSLVAGP